MNAEYITIITGSIIAVFVAFFKAIKHSRCTEINCCGIIKVKRDVLPPEEV